jgi:Fe-S cluster biogenesis protein NfuA/nitrite reductase/ring-hydroxylating ferredoxin subunit
VNVDQLPGKLLDRVQWLSAQVDELPDPGARELAQELVSAVIAIYGDGLRRIVETISEARDAGATILDQLAQDGAVASLLLIHDLYPVGLEERVVEALDTVRPYMESHGGNVELLGIEDGIAKLAMRGSCNGCAASRATLELAIKQALDEHAPDLLGLEVQGVSEPPANGHALGLEAQGVSEPPANGHALPMADVSSGVGFELPLVHSGHPPGSEVGGSELGGVSGGGRPPAHEERLPRWLPLERAADLEPGGLRVLAADGTEVLLANVAGALLAYRNACASCGEALQDGDLHASMLRCPHCAVEFDLRRAGRAAGGEPLQLTPVPLLEAGGVRVAV